MRIFLTFCLMLGLVLGTQAQVSTNVNTVYPDTLNKKRLAIVSSTVGGFYLAGNSYLAFVWYGDRARVPFHYYDDNAGWLQIDKLGHALGAYYYSNKGYYALRWAGVSHEKSLLYGGPLGLVLQTPIEVFDGLYAGYGFSWGDMIANTAGAALFSAQQWAWQDQIVKMKWSYFPSPYQPMYPYYLGNGGLHSVFRDYNAHTYWLSANLNRIVPIDAIPDWVNLAFGYSGNGMFREFDNPNYLYEGMNLREIPRTRQYLLSLDIDFTKMKIKPTWLGQVMQQLNMFKVPAPAIEYNAEQGWIFHFLYF
ncbi:MAG: DUF2279 domain-containing protein [Bacteroidota bacterium]